MENNNLPIGATQLDPDDLRGLIPTTITNRSQLDQFESVNIGEASLWAFKTKRKPSDILNINFCLKLHKRMFNKTWDWAGQFRRTEVNIGNTPPELVSTRLHDLCADAMAWIEFGSYSEVEIAIRFHHRMVWIHPFANGNGRHSRIMADLLVRELGFPLFKWGGISLANLSDSRRAYLDALRKADNGDFTDILTFAKSSYKP